MNLSAERLYYAITISCSSALLFSIQPAIAKALLPRFGGSAGVWIACMLFFQAALVLGYLYAFLVSRYLERRLQAALHVTLLAVSLFTLPRKPPVEWAAGSAHPVLSILGILAVSVGLPYFLLSTNSPLLQWWYAASPGARFPYRLFAWSNLASLVALLAYPVAIEPWLPVERQLNLWSDAYIAVALAVSVAALRNRSPRVAERGFEAPGWRRPLLWIALAACASTLWLAVANHLSQEVAAIPFLWVLPLSVYLLSFILCFERDGWYRPALFRWLLPAACIAVCWRVAFPGSASGLEWEIPVFLAALFTCAMFCHGELARGKPESPRQLAFFYLMLASGGALGAVFVCIVAPHAFSTYLELPIGITGCILLGLALLYGFAPRRLLRVAIMAALAFVAASRLRVSGTDVFHERNFYGALQVTDTGAGDDAVRTLYNGSTLHGRQFLAPARSRIPTAFYGVESGAGLALDAVRTPHRRVGVVGLGVGTLAAYGRPGDEFRFYEINPAVVEVASRRFRYLAECEAATALVGDDGRLALAREPAAAFDVLVLDAFSDDTIPVHLLTREAFDLYFRRLRPGGVLLVHVTNRYLELASVVKSAADSFGKGLLLVRNAENPARLVLPSDWAVVSGDRNLLRTLEPATRPGIAVRSIRPWTDGYSNLFQVLM